MAVIGCLGDIIFTVSEETTRTISKMQWGGSARYSVHDRHLTHALTEYTGRDPDRISFEIILSVELGTNPIDEVTKIWKYEREATAVPLTIGSKPYGKYRWTIANHEMTMQAFDRAGDVTHATISISLQEYLKGTEL